MCLCAVLYIEHEEIFTEVSLVHNYDLLTWCFILSATATGILMLINCYNKTHYNITCRRSPCRFVEWDQWERECECGGPCPFLWEFMHPMLTIFWAGLALTSYGLADDPCAHGKI